MRKLNLGKTYKLVQCYKLENSFCDHCDRIIQNVCEIENEDKQIFSVGSQCVKTLLELNGSDYWKNQEINKHIRNYFNMLLEFKKADFIVYTDYTIGTKTILKNGKTKISFYYNNEKTKNIDKSKWIYNNNSEDTGCLANFQSYLSNLKSL